MNSLVHLPEPLVGGLDLVLVLGIRGIAQGLEGNHESVALGVVHIDMTFVFRIAEDLPALLLYLFRGDLRGIVDDADGLPEVGDTVGVIRVIGEVFHAVGQAVQAADNVLVQRLELAFLNQALDHVIAGDHHVVGSAGEQFRIHLLVGREEGIVDLNAVFLFEFCDDLFVDILAPVIDVQHVAVAEGVQGQERQAQEQQDAGQGFRKGFLHFSIPPSWFCGL